MTGPTPGGRASPSPSLAAAGHDVRGMFDRIAGRYDVANRVMSAGVDGRWRRKALRALLAGLGPTPRILDLGAGTLDGPVEILSQCPGARIAAADFSRPMLVAGRVKLAGAGGAASGIHQADGHALPYRTAAFDGAFSAFCVRNLHDLGRASAELRRVMRPGGRVAILEFFRPVRPRLFFDRIYNAHVLPLVGWAVSGDREAYRYLPDSIARFASRAEYETVLRAAGFSDVVGEDLFPGAVASLVVAS